MREMRTAVIAAVAALALAACDGSGTGDRPQEYQIDQDVYASHGAGAPTSTNQGTPGFETWRRKDSDTFGHTSGH